MDFKTKLLNYFNIDENLYKELSKPINELTLPNPSNFEGIEKAKSIIDIGNNINNFVIYKF